MSTYTLRPGYLVSLTTHHEGGRLYETLDEKVSIEEGTTAEVTNKNVKLTIFNPEEYKSAQKELGKAAEKIRSLCPRSSHWLICPADKEPELRAAIDDAHGVCAAFNATSDHSQVELYVITAKMAGSDEEATRAIAADMRDLIVEMQRGIKGADPEAIREAARKAQSYGQILDEATSKKLGDAVKEARYAATLIKKLEGDAVNAAAVIAQINTSALETARYCFLDLEEGERVEVEQAAGPSVDLESAQDAVRKAEAELAAIEAEVK